MLKERVNRFVGHFLAPYVVSATKSKFVHDPLWGTIEVKAYEQCFLDNPLLQRLRQIHQTGCAFSTYPSATHSRFEHTIGVMHLASRIAESLRKRYPRLSELRQTEQRVRLAALFHDLGHSAFSHTSEEVYEQCDDIQELIRPQGPYAGKGAGEVLSYLIITSTHFREYFERIKSQHDGLVEEIDNVAPLILGRSNDTLYQFEADIISGPFDADKLDYFSRDGRAVGIELSLDIDRLLHCIELGTFPNTLTKGEVRSLVINRGGYNAIQQLLFARATLFATVYHHHKVRACDCMVKACFERFREGNIHFGGKRSEASQDRPLTSAADFLFLSDVDFFSEASHHDADSAEHCLIHNLLYRRLLKRVLIISSHTVQNFEEDDDQKAAYGAFYNLGADNIAQRDLARELHRVSGVNCLPSYVWFDFPRNPTFDKTGIARINVGLRGKSNPRYEKLGRFIPVKEWVDTYRQYYAQSLLFGPPDKSCRVKLGLAARKLLKERFKLVLTEYSLAEDIREEVLREESGASSG